MFATSDTAYAAAGAERAVRTTRPRPERESGERELLRGLRQGDPEAQEVLVRQHSGAMLAVARRYLRDEEEARDAVQEAFLQAMRAIGSFRGDARLSTWLHRITVTTALMRLRSQRRRREESIEDLLPRFADDGTWREPCGEWEEQPDEAIGRKQMRALVRACIEQLPETYRRVLILRDIEDVDTREAAWALGITETAVKVRLHRARQALRTLLDPHLR